MHFREEGHYFSIRSWECAMAATIVAYFRKPLREFGEKTHFDPPLRNHSRDQFLRLNNGSLAQFGLGLSFSSFGSAVVMRWR